jgi:hypothetical protein
MLTVMDIYLPYPAPESDHRAVEPHHSKEHGIHELVRVPEVSKQWTTEVTVTPVEVVALEFITAPAGQDIIS